MEPKEFCNAVEIHELDEENRVAFFNPLNPMQDVGDGVFVTAKAIERSCHDFAKNVRLFNIDHEEMAPASLVENIFARNDFLFPNSRVPIKKGSWVVGVHAESDNLWNDIKEGRIKGSSPAGSYDEKYFDEKLGKWIATKITVREISLVKKLTPKNNISMLFANAQEGEESMVIEKEKGKVKEEEEEEVKESEKKKKVDAKEKEFDMNKLESELDSKRKHVNEKQESKLDKTIEKLTSAVEKNTEVIQKLDPNFSVEEAKKERQNLIDILTNSKDSKAKELLIRLNEETPISEPEKVAQVVAEPIKNVISFGSNLINPNQMISKQRNLEEKPKVVNTKLADEETRINEKYEKDRKLDPFDKQYELEQARKKYA